MGSYLPPGWPDGVRPPGSADWEIQAVGYLLDCCPPDFRGQRIFRRHPVVLATFAAHCLRGQQRAAADGLADVRGDLGDLVEPHVVDEAVDCWQAEVARLARVERSVDLLRRGLQGERFVPKMQARA
jgi:hypothetical protein